MANLRDSISFSNLNVAEPLSVEPDEEALEAAVRALLLGEPGGGGDGDGGDGGGDSGGRILRQHQPPSHHAQGYHIPFG